MSLAGLRTVAVVALCSLYADCLEKRAWLSVEEDQMALAMCFFLMFQRSTIVGPSLTSVRSNGVVLDKEGQLREERRMVSLRLAGARLVGLSLKRAAATMVDAVAVAKFVMKGCMEVVEDCTIDGLSMTAVEVVVVAAGMTAAVVVDIQAAVH